MSNKIVTSIYNVIDDNIEQVNDTRIICIDIAKGFVGLHKSDPVCTLDVNGTINCQYLYINDVSINTIINNYNLLNTNLIPLNDNTINLGTATKYWLNAYIYDLSAETIDVVANINPFTNATGSLGSTSKYWGNSYIRDLSVISIDVSVNFNPLTDATESIGSFSKYIRNAYIRSISLESIDISINLNPLFHETGSLGSTSKNWSNAYINDLSAGSIDVSVNLNPLINGSGSLGVTNKIWGNAYINDLSIGSIDVSVNLSPLIPGTGSLGSTTKYWNNAYINDLSVTSINNGFFENTISYETIIVDIIPQNDTESLGLSNKKWGNAYIRDLSVQSITISVNLNMKNNNIININKLTGDVSNNIITTTSRIYQEISGDISWNAVNGYYGLAKDAYPRLNSLSSGEKAVSSWTDRVPVTQRDTTFKTAWNGICWSPELRLFVSVGYREGDAKTAATSPDGITWTPRNAPIRRWMSVCWSPENELFVAVADTTRGSTTAQPLDPSGAVMYSSDGINWILSENPIGRWYAICWSKELGLFVAIEDDDTKITRSSDGISWNTITIQSTIKSICWSPQLGLFVAVGRGNIVTSTDGTTWITRLSINQEVNLHEICWSPELQIFVAVGSGFQTSANKIERLITSSDGITWTSRSLPISETWKNLTWSPQLGIFVLLNDGGGQVLISGDGINWKHILGISVSCWDCCWCAELGIFVACGVFALFTSSLKGRPPTSYIVFDSSFNSIDESGNWTFSKITTPAASITDLSGVITINELTGISGINWTQLVTRINNKYAELFPNG
jgi:hypothetical protein